MKKCPFCGAELKDDSLFCIECGKELPKGIECPHCGASVNEGDIFCTECGKRLDEVPQATSSEPTKPKCPHCGALINEGDVFCMECGKKIDEAQTEKTYEVFVTKECPHCGATIREDAHFCPNCDKYIEDAPAESTTEVYEPIKKECPHCGALVDENDVRCEKCGKFLIEGVEDEFEEKTFKDYLPFIFATIVVFLLIGGAWWYWESSNQRVAKETVISDSLNTATDSLSEELSPDEVILERVKTIYDDMYKVSSNGDSYWLSTELNSLIKKDSEVTPEGELGCIDYDIWTQSQGGDDGEPSVKVESVEKLSENKAISTITLNYPNNTFKRLRLMLVYERNDWYIDDFITNYDGNKSSLKNDLIDCIKQTEQHVEGNENSKGHDFGLNTKYHHHLVGTFEDSSGAYPIELDFDSSGRDVTNVVYTNVKVGSKIHLTCTYFDLWRISVSGKDGGNYFEISLECASESLLRGIAVDGNKQFVVVMEAKCSH